MDVWEETLIAWVNAVSDEAPITRLNELKSRVDTLMKKLAPGTTTNFVSFINQILPRYLQVGSDAVIESDLDFLCALSGMLVYISFSTKPEINPVKEAMQTKISEEHQEYILKFLLIFQKYDVDKLTFGDVKYEIEEFRKTHKKTETSVIGDGIMTTPVKKNRSSPTGFGSPLMEFFRTPKRRIERREGKCSSCIDWVKRNKELHSQLAEIEHEKTSLEDDLRKQTQKCHKYEKELNQKTQQIQELEHQWAGETDRNNEKFNKLHKNLQDKMNSEKRLKSELEDSEKYISTLKEDLSNSHKSREKIETQLRELLERNKNYESEIAESSLKIAELSSTVSILENQITSMRENFPHLYELDHTFEASFDKSLDVSVSVPETMNIVVEKILSERNAENAELKDKIDEMKIESDELKNKILSLQEEVTSLLGEKSDLGRLNRELQEKLEEFNKVRLVLEEVECKLISETKKVDKFFKENSRLSRSLTEREVELKEALKSKTEVEESKKALEVDYKKLTWDFKEQLENVSRLTTEIEEKHLELQKTLEDFSELKSEHEGVKKCVGYVDAVVSKNLERLMKEGTSTESFASCFSVESKIDKLADLLHQLEVYNLETAESRAVLEKTCVQLNESIVSLKSEIMEREDKERSNMKKIKDLERVLDVTEKKVVDLEESYTSKIEKIKKELEEKCEKIERLTKVLQENEVVWMGEKDELLGELTKVTKEFARAEEKVKDLEGLLAIKEKDHEAELSVVFGELERLRKDVSELSEENARLSVSLEKKLQEIKELKEVEVEGLKRDLEEAEGLKKNLSCELLLAKEKLDLAVREAKKKEKDLEGVVAEKEKRLVEMKNVKDDLEGKLGELKEKCERLKNKCGVVEKEKEKTERELKRIRSELEKVIVEREKRLVEMEKLKDDLSKRLDDKNGELLSLQSLKGEMIREMERIALESKGKSQSIKELEEKCMIVGKEKEEMGRELERIRSELKKVISDFEMEKEKRLAEMKNMTDERDELLKKLDVKSGELLSLQSLKDEIVREMERIDLESRGKSESIKMLEEKCMIVDKEKEEMGRELERIRSELKKVIDDFELEKERRLEEMKNMKEEREDLLKKLDVKSGELLSMQALKDETVKENQNLNLESERKSENIKKLEEKCKSVEREKEKTERELKRIRSELKRVVSDLESEKEKRLEEIKNMKEERDDLLKKLDVKSGELLSLQALKDEMLTENQNLNLKLSEKSENIEKLEEKCKIVEREKEKTERELERIRSELKRVISDLESEKEERLEEIKNMKEEREDLLKKLDVSSCELLSIQALKDEMLKENQRLNLESKGQSENIKKLEKKCKIVESEKEKTEGELERIRSELNGVIADLESEKERKLEEIKNMKHEREDLLKKLDVKSGELLSLQALKDEMVKEQQNLNFQLSEKSEYIQELEKKCATLEREEEKTEKELERIRSELKQVIADFESEKGRRLEEIENMKAERDDLLRQLDVKNSELLSLQTLNDEVVKQMQKLDLESKKKGDSIKKLEETCGIFQREKEETKMELNRVESELASQKRAFELEKSEKLFEIECMKRERDDLLKRLEVKSCELLNLQSLKDEIIRENQNLNLEFREKSESIQKLEEKCKVITRDKEKIENELKRIKSELESVVSSRKTENEQFQIEKERRLEEITNMKEERDDLLRQLDVKTGELLNLQSLKEEMIREKENLNLESREKSESIQKFEEKCKILTGEKDKIENELQRIKSELESVMSSHETELEQAKTEKEIWLTEIRNIKSQRDDLLKRLEVKSNELLSLQSLKDKMVKENEKIVGALENDLKKAKEEFEMALKIETEKRSELELTLNEERRSLESLTSEMGELESQRDKILRLSSEMKHNVTDLKSLLSGKELEIIYDKGIMDSASQFSLLEEEHGLSRQSSLSSLISSGVDVNNADVEIEMEGLNREIISAKKSLFAFLQATAKHMEELKIKEDLVKEMSKEHKDLEIRISSLSDLNARLTKEILESKNVMKIEVEYKEKELGCLKEEVESLTKASELLKGKLADLERINEVLSRKKEESSNEISRLREENRTLTNDLQSKVANRLREQNACLGLIRCKQETELELERALTVKNNLEQKIFDLRKTIPRGETISLTNIEQKLYIASEKLLHSTYLLLKWASKNMDRQFSIGDDFNDSKENVYDEKIIRDKLTLANEILQSISESIKELEQKSQPAFSDSLEEISIGNKTFDIVNLDEHVNDRTFSIAKGNIKKETSSAAAWVVSPPSKTAPKPPPPKNYRKPSIAESWVVPMDPPVKLKKSKPVHRSLASIPASTKEQKSLSKSSSLSDIDYSPPGKRDSKTDSEIKKEMTGSPPAEAETETKRETDFAGKEKVLEKKIWDLQKEILENVKENERLKNSLFEAEQRRRKEKEAFEKGEDAMRQKITAKYEAQLDDLKAEMKSLYNKEMAKHKTEQSKLNSDLLEQNKTYKEHIDELRNQQWHLGEKLYQERKLKDDWERKYNDLKKKFEKSTLSAADQDSKSSYSADFLRPADGMTSSEFNRLSVVRQLPTAKFSTMPTEDEDEIFDNRRLEDLKAGRCQVDGGPDNRLSELQFRNSMCLPHLKSSYPAETQFHNPRIFRENELKFGHLNFGQESASLTDSDHSMTKSLLPDEKAKKKEQTSYKRPGPPTPSKNGGRLSLQSGDLRLTPRNILKEQNDNKGTPGRLKSFFTSKSSKRDSIGCCKDENTAPVTPRGKKLKLFKTRKPFGVVREF